jgi:Rieske Fe-S protein
MRRLLIALSLLGVVLGTAMIFFLWPPDQQQADEVVAGTVDEVQSRQVFYLAEHGVFAVAADGRFLALSDDARHVGDRVLYCAQDNTFSSPAHGETFDRLGRYMFGPAAGDLGRYRIVVTGDPVLVDLLGELELPDRSPTSDAPAGPRCDGAEDPPGFYHDRAP